MKYFLPALLLPLTLCQPAQALLFDHSIYDSILRHYVNEEGWVDYASIRENSQSALESYFERLAEADLGGWSRQERLAFWINAYNAHVLQLVVDHPDMKKMSEQFDLWNVPFKIAGKMLTLNDIDYRILRNRVNPDNQQGPVDQVSLDKADPRVFAALARGTVSGPKLRNFAYTAENVEDILQANAVAFANSEKAIDVLNGQLRVSALMRWYAKDLLPLGGWRKYLSDLIDSDKRDDADQLKTYLADETKKPQYQYDWTINDVKNSYVP